MNYLAKMLQEGTKAQDGFGAFTYRGRGPLKTTASAKALTLHVERTPVPEGSLYEGGPTGAGYCGATLYGEDQINDWNSIPSWNVCSRCRAAEYKAIGLTS